MHCKRTVLVSLSLSFPNKEIVTTIALEYSQWDEDNRGDGYIS